MTGKQQQRAQLISLLQSLDYTVNMLPVLLGTTGGIFYSTLTNIKNADRVDKLASRLSLHAQHTIQSIIQSCRVIEISD